MPRDFLTPVDEADWLAMREVDLTSTEVSALFGCSPYLTEYELFHRKTGQVVADFDNDNERMKWGRRLEAAIAEGVAEDAGLIIEPFKTYGRITERRMGSSFDFKIVGLRDDWSGDERFRDLFREHGPGIMEVKNVDGLAFKRGWIDDDELEAPPHIELQVQHQMEVADLDWALMAPLVGGNTPRPAARVRDRDIGELITAKVAEFWRRVDEGRSPEPDFEQDGKTIGQLYLNSNGQSVDMSDNTYLATLCAEHRQASAAEADAKKRKDALKAEMLTIIGESAKVKVGEFAISAGTVADNEGTLITSAMVGQRMGGRRGYRSFRLTEKRTA